MGRLGFSVLGFGLAFCAAASAQDLPFSHQVSDEPVMIVAPDDLAGLAHRQMDLFPPIEVALTQDEPKQYSPRDAIGKGTFGVKDNALRHRKSGLVCRITQNLQKDETRKVIEKLFLYRVIVYKEDGSDVSCAYINREQNFRLTVHASQWPDIGLEEHFLYAFETIITRETAFDKQVPAPVTEPSRTAKASLPEDSKAVVFDGKPDEEGNVRREALWLNKTDKGWHVKVRSSHTPPADEPILLSMLVFAGALENVTEDGKPVPTPAEVSAASDRALRTVSWQSE